MKKTFTINLNSIVFHIDDDAYEQLQSYLKEVGRHFEEEDERADIMADIEARIAELFSEKMDTQKNVITIDDVNEVIEIMGKPSQFDDSDEETGEKESKEKKSERAYKKLYRDIDNRLLGGVASGMAAYFNVDVTLIRVIIVVLTLVSSGTFVPIYLLMWLIVPKAITTTQKLEMHGEDINIETIKNKMMDAKEYIESEKFKESANDIGTRLWKVLSGLIKIAFSVLGVIFSIIGVILIAALLFALIVFLFESDAVLSVFPELSALIGSNSPDKVILLIISLLLIVGTPIFALIYWSMHVISKDKSKSKRRPSGLWVTLLLWLAGIFMFIGTGVETLKNINKSKWSRQYNEWTPEDSTDPESLTFSDSERKLSPFTSINVSSAIEVELKQQDKQFVKVNTLEAFQENVRTEVRNGELRIYVVNKLINPKIKVEIGIDSLEKVKASGASKVNISTPFSLKNLNINLSGASKVTIDTISAQKLDVDISGASKFNIKGVADTLQIDCSGASKIIADSLITKVSHADINGASSAKLQALESFKGKASGASKIKVIGKPEERNIKSTGSSQIEFE